MVLAIIRRRGANGPTPFEEDVRIVDINELSGLVVDAAMAVHTALGAGLFEHPYSVCLRHELSSRGINARSEVTLPVVYKGITIDTGYRLDLLVEDLLIVELKSVEQITALHRAQLLTYLKLAKKTVGLIINFNTPHLKNGIVRLIDSGSAINQLPGRVV